MKSCWKIPVFFFVCSFLGPWASATIKRRPRFPVNSHSNGENELCPKIRIGQDDLPGFDLISQFQVDRAASQRSIQRVVGSTALQVAYKLGSNVDFRIPTRHLYPSGLPEEYSFLTTFRMTGSTLEKNWNIWQIQDSSGKEQVGVKINGQTQSVAFSYKGLDGSLRTAAFSKLPSLFDSQWHKIMIGVERTSATLFLDCVRIESLPIKPRDRIDVGGFAVLGKLADSPHVSVPDGAVYPPTELCFLAADHEHKCYNDRSFIVCCQHDCRGELFGSALSEDKVSLPSFSERTLGTWACLREDKKFMWFYKRITQTIHLSIYAYSR